MTGLHVNIASALIWLASHRRPARGRRWPGWNGGRHGGLIRPLSSGQVGPGQAAGRLNSQERGGGPGRDASPEPAQAGRGHGPAGAAAGT